MPSKFLNRINTRSLSFLLIASLVSFGNVVFLLFPNLVLIRKALWINRFERLPIPGGTWVFKTTASRLLATRKISQNALEVKDLLQYAVKAMYKSILLMPSIMMCAWRKDHHISGRIRIENDCTSFELGPVCYNFFFFQNTLDYYVTRRIFSEIKKKDRANIQTGQM